MSSNYYDLLEASRDDSYDELRQSYRKQVKKYHPDVSELPNAQERFQQIKTAYKILSHPKKRKKYNQISHSEFVSQYGGYTSDEIKNITEDQLISKEKAGSQSSPPRPQSYGQANKTECEPNQNGNNTSTNPKFNWILQARTAKRSGYAAYTIRFIIYYILCLVIVLSLGNIVGYPNYVYYLPTTLLLSRLIYLAVFEYLRESYDRIDKRPEPDAYTIPYAVGISIAGLPLLLIFTLLGSSGTGVSRILSFGSGLVGFILFGSGLIGTVLAVGWGVADDYYNLQLNVNPVYWNFLAQAPLIIAISTSSLWPASLLLIFIPLLVGIVYTVTYHREIGSSIIDRVTE